MQLSVLTPDQEYFSGEITSVKVPGVLGEFQVLNNHAPIVSALSEEKYRLRLPMGKYCNSALAAVFLLKYLITTSPYWFKILGINPN
jgi:F0F1-type ATP synthase epsilon subunit